jgi:hypothetical protein
MNTHVYTSYLAVYEISTGNSAESERPEKELNMKT